MKSTVRLIKLAPILLNMYVAIVLTLSLMDVEVVSFDYVLGHSVYVDIMLWHLSKRFRFCSWHRVLIINLLIQCGVQLIDVLSNYTIEFWTLLSIASVSVVVSAVTSTILYFKHGCCKIDESSRLFRHFADMIDNGYCDNITEDDIDAMTEVLKPYLNVKVNYEQAKKITGKTDSAFNSKISRCGLKPTKERLYRYIDMVKIKHKKV